MLFQNTLLLLFVCRTPLNSRNTRKASGISREKARVFCPIFQTETPNTVHRLQSCTGTKQDLRFRSRSDWFVSVVVVGEFFCAWRTTDDDELDDDGDEHECTETCWRHLMLSEQLLFTILHL